MGESWWWWSQGRDYTSPVERRRTGANTSLVRHQPAVDRHHAHRRPVVPAVPAENGDLRVDEMAVLEHLPSRFGAGEAPLRPQHDRARAVARQERGVGGHARDEVLVENLVWRVHLTEYCVDLHAGDRPV